VAPVLPDAQVQASAWEWAHATELKPMPEAQVEAQALPVEAHDGPRILPEAPKEKLMLLTG
jgi:hypothetical protein